MSTLQLFERTPFDILVRNFFQDASVYAPIDTQKLPHPVDVYEADNGLGIDIACTGIAKEDLDIQIQGNIIRLIMIKAKSKMIKIIIIEVLLNDLLT
jgi:HSP20 family molecular chaperone IbpA